MEKRRFERKMVSLDAELIVDGKSYAARITSISEKGMGVFLESAFMDYTSVDDAGVSVELNFKPLSDDVLNLRCALIWSKIYKNSTNIAGLQITVESPAYEAFVRSF